MIKLVAAIINFNRTVSGVLFILLMPSILTPVRYFAPEEKIFAAAGFIHDEDLQAEADSFLPLFDKMPPVPVFLTDEPVIKSGTNRQKGLAYTTCDNYESPSIFVKKIFYQKNNRKQITNALKHELTHAWLCYQRAMSGHDNRFYEKFREVGGFGN